MMKDKKFVEDSFQRVQVDKIFSWTETQVHPTETPISEEEFTRMVEEHKHQH
jgi:trigger factor